MQMVIFGIHGDTWYTPRDLVFSASLFARPTHDVCALFRRLRSAARASHPFASRPRSTGSTLKAARRMTSQCSASKCSRRRRLQLRETLGRILMERNPRWTPRQLCAHGSRRVAKCILRCEQSINLVYHFVYHPSSRRNLIGPCVSCGTN